LVKIREREREREGERAKRRAIPIIMYVSITNFFIGGGRFSLMEVS
jgi:hypothetical protein